jgi:peptidoglycan/LPS O-acetylase OafA/YrhL
MIMRNQSLDFLRALAILMVFTGHTVLSYGAPSTLSPLQFGGTGVDLFFVLSGWLIGYQLFKELQRHGNIEIKRFWIRRWMRTIPAYYAVLIFTIGQNLITKDNFSIPWNYFFFVQNYADAMPIFTVSWSLSVEEQFYLVIAPLIVFLHKIKKNHRTILLIMLMILPTVFRELELYKNLQETHVRWDCCIMGILLANICFSYPKFWQRLVKTGPKLAFTTLCLYLSFYYFRWFPNDFMTDPSKLLLAFIFGSWILWANTKNLSLGFLTNKFIYYISTRSYAIYLLHPDALAVTQRLFSDEYFIFYYLFAFILSCFAAEFLYRLIELPIMNVRSKFSFAQSRKKSLPNGSSQVSYNAQL